MKVKDYEKMSKVEMAKIIIEKNNEITCLCKQLIEAKEALIAKNDEIIQFSKLEPKSKH